LLLDEPQASRHFKKYVVWFFIAGGKGIRMIVLFSGAKGLSNQLEAAGMLPTIAHVEHRTKKVMPWESVES
jgi:hypothetical protein